MSDKINDRRGNGWFVARRTLLMTLTLSLTMMALGERSTLAPSTVFVVSPIPTDKIRAIIPLGNLNPRGGHVFPTDHIYLDYGDQPDLAVAAPAQGRYSQFEVNPSGILRLKFL
jgi:hypothetical protein